MKVCDRITKIKLGGVKEEKWNKIHIPNIDANITYYLHQNTKVIYKQWRADIGEIIRKLCAEKRLKSLRHKHVVHMLVSITTISECSTVCRIRVHNDIWQACKFKYGRRSFWARGEIVGWNEKAIKEYIKN